MGAEEGLGLPGCACECCDLLVVVWQVPELAWSATGSRELGRSGISWLNCTYSAYSQQWIFSVWSSASQQRPVCSGRSVWRSREHRGAGKVSGLCCVAVVGRTPALAGTSLGQPVLLWSAGLILTALTGQDLPPERSKNVGYMMLNLINFSKTYMLPRTLLPCCRTSYRTKLKWSPNFVFL